MAQNAANIATIQTYHASPAHIQNEEIRAVFTEGLNDIQIAEVALSNANIVAMFTTPVEVVAAIAGKTIEFLSATLIYDFDTAALTGGGAITIDLDGGAAQSGTIAAATSLLAVADNVYKVGAIATELVQAANTALVITNATGVFVNGGTADGVARVKVAYRVHATGL